MNFLERKYLREALNYANVLETHYTRRREPSRDVEIFFVSHRARDDLQSVYMLAKALFFARRRPRRVILMCRETNEEINVICFVEQPVMLLTIYVLFRGGLVRFLITQH